MLIGSSENGEGEGSQHVVGTARRSRSGTRRGGPESMEVVIKGGRNPKILLISREIWRWRKWFVKALPKKL